MQVVVDGIPCLGWERWVKLDAPVVCFVLHDALNKPVSVLCFFVGDISRGGNSLFVLKTFGEGGGRKVLSRVES